MSEPFLNKILRHEAKVITQRVVQCRKQLGSRGGTTTAIRLFGKLGSTLPHDSIEGNVFQSRKPTISDADSINAIRISPRTLRRTIRETIYSSLISFLGGVCMVIAGIFVAIWKFLTSNKLIIFGLALSCLFNVFLMGRSTQSYWMDKNVQKYADKISLLPTSQEHPVMERSIFLQDIDKLLLNGSSFSVEKSMQNELGQNSTQSLCYDKFQALALVPDDGGEFFSPERYLNYKQSDPIYRLKELMPSQLLYYDEPSTALRERIYRIRSKLGIQRNSLIVELRMVNRIESELIMAEWRSFVYDEVSICSQMLQDVAFLYREQRYLGTQQPPNDTQAEFEKALDSAKRGKTQDGSPFLNVLRASSLEVKQAVGRYCQSCSRELGTLKSALKDGNI